MICLHGQSLIDHGPASIATDIWTGTMERLLVVWLTSGISPWPLSGEFSVARGPSMPWDDSYTPLDAAIAQT